jgi:hypothetical protein
MIIKLWIMSNSCGCDGYGAFLLKYENSSSQNDQQLQ